jgi:hypothetical protein
MGPAQKSPPSPWKIFAQEGGEEDFADPGIGQAMPK